MAIIKIWRTSEHNNSGRYFRIFLNGKELGEIADGETKDFIASAGRHTITAKVDWCGSPDLAIDINDNETKTLKVGGFKETKLLIFYFLTFGRKKYLTLEEA